MSLFDEIYREWAAVPHNYLCDNPKAPEMRLLINYKASCDLRADRRVSEMMVYCSDPRRPLELLGMPIVETEAIEGWEIVIVSRSGNGAAKAA